MSYAAPPFVLPTPAVIGVHCPWSAFYFAISDSAVAPVSSTPVANEAIYVPFVVTTPATFTRGWWRSGTLADGVTAASVGIYDTAGGRLATTGAVVVTTTPSIIQSAAFSASVALTPGTYYMAVSFSAADANGIFAYATSIYRGRVSGLYRQATAHPVPATATFATWTNQVLPFFGVTTTSFAI